MKSIIKRSKNLLIEKKDDVKAFIASNILLISLWPTKVMAAPSIKPGLGSEAGVGAILSVIFEVAFYIGAVGIVMGVFMTIQSFMSDNPESRNRGVTLAIIGAVLMGLEALLKTAGILS